MIVLKALSILVAALLAACAGVTGYACVLMLRRPPLKLYRSRSAQPDFLPLDQIPARQLELIVRQEDPNFYNHPGFDADGIRRAWQMNRRAGRIVCGGSTITQQLAKNLYLRFTRSYFRKAVELVIALALERRLGKDRILELYVNIIYFGNGVYGLSDAARFYFNKPARDLTLGQMVLLTILPSAPTACNPIQHPEAFRRLRDRRLPLLAEKDPPLLSPDEAADIRARGAACLDPELRAPDDFTRSYPQTVPMVNARFGPFADGRGT